MKFYPEKLSKAQRKFLKELFPEGESGFSDGELLSCGVDASRKHAKPLALVKPHSVKQVSELLAWAQKERMPIYPRARATNKVGGCVPVKNGVVVSMLGMNSILDIDPQDFVAVVQPGVITADLQKSVEKQGLFYPPDPASLKISTIGGNISTCAGGMRAVKYGVTRDYVLGLEVVIPGGEVIHTGGRTHKNVVGLDLTRLMVGSAGSLGLITQATLKLLPLPETSASVLIGFENLPGCLKGAEAVFGCGILPTAMELMDRNTLKALKLHSDVPWPEETGGVLLLKIDGSSESVEADLRQIEKALSNEPTTFLEKGSGEDQERLWELRRVISPAAFNLAPDKQGEDVAVPRGKVAQAIESYHEIGKKLGLVVMCFGHLGDGNIHVSVMYDKSAPGQSDNALKAKKAIFSSTLALGGTLSGEHGIGLTKADYLGMQIGDTELNLMHRIKDVFDPLKIMNPGKAV
ncbi:glycolate oxidase [Maridesulfovibrio ferrireducens]|uniref:Glycolate oxidase n=1 Tax=Maridesulfovibrio ferrireducens TaxID=246191 RepID=A0A1G9BK36_9BACT|nr:FAD-linked oxidase C-terminal domain-containing protein [Maridesulfovibrio ferrireducens]SDK39889.1 glycolate oxidase [Maridesulfovibrio ferrireducens]